MCLAIPGKIVEISGEGSFRTAKVNFDGLNKSNISLLFCPNANVADFCLVHAGNALEIINEEVARETMTLLNSYSVQ